MGFLPSSPLAHQTIIDIQRLRNLLRVPGGMGMSCQDNACASGYGLRTTMGLGKLEELFHFMRSQVKRRYELRSIPTEMGQCSRDSGTPDVLRFSVRRVGTPHRVGGDHGRK